MWSRLLSLVLLSYYIGSTRSILLLLTTPTNYSYSSTCRAFEPTTWGSSRRGLTWECRDLHYLSMWWVDGGSVVLLVVVVVMLVVVVVMVVVVVW